MVVEHLVDIGRRDAGERTAHFLLELGALLSLVGMGSKAGYVCPLRLYLMADALGLSAVHVNRVLRMLRQSEMVTFRDGCVTFDDYTVWSDSLISSRLIWIRSDRYWHQSATNLQSIQTLLRCA